MHAGPRPHRAFKWSRQLILIVPSLCCHASIGTREQNESIRINRSRLGRRDVDRGAGAEARLFELELDYGGSADSMQYSALKLIDKITSTGWSWPGR
jgi:hypothetical protein